MTEVHFGFAIGEKVIDRFGEIGIVDMQAISKHGVVYFVRTRADAGWVYEEDLERAHEEFETK